MRSVVWSMLAAALLASCGGTSKVPVPPGLEPLEDDIAPEPAPVNGDATPETLSTINGTGDGYDYAHGKGYIHAPLTAVYAALQVPDVVVDHRNVDKYTVSPNVETGYDVSFRLHDESDAIVTVTFDITWRQGVTDGTKDAPLKVQGRSLKTAGTSFITSMDVSVVLTQVSANVTKVELVEHINSAESSGETIEQYLKDLYANLLAKSHGQPVPKYR